MGKITVETCEIDGLKVITPAVYGDARGYFMETYNYNDFKAAGIPEVFVQDNQSSSARGVLRVERGIAERRLDLRNLPFQRLDPPWQRLQFPLLLVREFPGTI